MKVLMTVIIVVVLAFADAKRLNKGASAKKVKNVKKAEPVAAETATMAETALLQKATAPNDEVRDTAESYSTAVEDPIEERDTPSTDEQAESASPAIQHNAQVDMYLKVLKTREIARKRVEDAKVGVFKVINKIVTTAKGSGGYSEEIMNAVGRDLVDALVAFAGGSKALAAAVPGDGKVAVVPKDSNPELMCKMAKQLIKWARCREENDSEENECKKQPPICSDIKSTFIPGMTSTAEVLFSGMSSKAAAFCKTNGCEWTDGACHAPSGSVKEALESFLAEVKEAEWELKTAKVKSTAQEETAKSIAFAEHKWKEVGNWMQEQMEKPEWQSKVAKVKSTAQEWQSTAQEKIESSKTFAKDTWKQGSNWVQKQVDKRRQQ